MTNQVTLEFTAIRTLKSEIFSKDTIKQTDGHGAFLGRKFVME
jgi:hypothetical protein